MRDFLKEVFKDTKKLYSTDETLKASVEFTLANQKLYLEEEEVDISDKKPSFETKIVVSKKRSFQAAEAYKNESVGVLNFANSFEPGGGVIYGARAQEESLCRLSTLYAAISTDEMRQDFYDRHIDDDDPLATDDVIYSPGVMVFKSDDSEMKLLDKSEWFNVNVLTCAAPDLYDKDISDDELFELHVKRWQRILSVALKNGCTTLVLGAFGCGAFRNNPEIVAKAAKQIVDEFKGYFKCIEFAVACKDDWTNYEVFNKYLLET